MNCRDFEHYILGLGSEQRPEARVLAHAGSCETCGIRFKQAQELHSLLIQVALQDQAIEAPGRIEIALLDEIQRMRDTAPPRTPVRTPVWTRKAALALGTAAMIALALVASIIYSRWNRDRTTMSQDNSGSRAIKETPNRVVDGGHQDAGGKAGRNHPQEPSNIEPRPRKRAASQMNARRPQPPENAEIATDYFPINYGTYLQPIDSGQIVRIKLRRSVLGSYGLPVDPLQADEPISADVVIGSDGIARAIRFVR